jgi:hypothetical protein
LPHKNKHPATWQKELDPLFYLIKIILRLNVVLGVIPAVLESDQGREADRRIVERDRPYAEDLEDPDIKCEIGFVKCCA